MVLVFEFFTVLSKNVILVTLSRVDFFLSWKIVFLPLIFRDE